MLHAVGAVFLNTVSRIGAAADEMGTPGVIRVEHIGDAVGKKLRSTA